MQVREELQKCWRTEGVNHYEVCHPLTEKYLDLLRTNRVRTFTLSLSLLFSSRAVRAACGWARACFGQRLTWVFWLQVEGFRKLDYSS